MPACRARAARRRTRRSIEDAHDAGRLGRREATRPDRVLDLGHRRAAHLLPRCEALAQTAVGHVAVAVVGVLREHREHELVHRRMVRAEPRAAVLPPQAIPDGAQSSAVGWLRHRRKAMPLARLAFKRRAPGRALRSHGATSWAFCRGRARYPPLSAAGRTATTWALVPARGLVAPGTRARGAALRGRLPDLAAAHRRPRRAHVPRRVVRRGGLHHLERPVVRRSPHAGVQHHLAADRLAARAAGGSGAGRAGLCRALRAARPRLLRGRALPLGSDLVRRGHRHAALHQPAPVRDRRGIRAGCAACAAAQALRAGDRLRMPLPAR